jgi:transcriptional regulator with XRE-family HTH domain
LNVKVSGVFYIGKEANRLEEQSYLGIDPEAEIAYGSATNDRESLLAYMRNAADAHGLSRLAREAGVSRQHLNAVLSGRAVPSAKTLTQLSRSATKLGLARDAEGVEATMLFKQIRKIGVRKCAGLAGIDAGHLTRLITGKRKPTRPILERLQRALARKGDVPT